MRFTINPTLSVLCVLTLMSAGCGDMETETGRAPVDKDELIFSEQIKAMDKARGVEDVLKQGEENLKQQMEQQEQ